MLLYYGKFIELNYNCIICHGFRFPPKNSSDIANRIPAEIKLAKGRTDKIIAALYFLRKKNSHEKNESSTRTGNETIEAKRETTKTLLSEPGASKSMNENADIHIAGISRMPKSIVSIISVVNVDFLYLPPVSFIDFYNKMRAKKFSLFRAFVIKQRYKFRHLKIPFNECFYKRYNVPATDSLCFA
ncbi:MAG: hypothetical protein LWX07_02040 [Bacteroidetes bacterium]|nr:hypothetical protein [Bacteroidota bacterium]